MIHAYPCKCKKCTSAADHGQVTKNKASNEKTHVSPKIGRSNFQVPKQGQPSVTDEIQLEKKNLYLCCLQGQARRYLYHLG